MPIQSFYFSEHPLRQMIRLIGDPGCGRTSLIQRGLADQSRPAGGFYTQQVREGVIRKVQDRPEKFLEPLAALAS